MAIYTVERFPDATSHEVVLRISIDLPRCIGILLLILLTLLGVQRARQHSSCASARSATEAAPGQLR